MTGSLLEYIQRVKALRNEDVTLTTSDTLLPTTPSNAEIAALHSLHVDHTPVIELDASPSSSSCRIFTLLIAGEDQQQRRKSGWLEKSRSTWAPVLGGEEEQPPAVRRDVRLYGEEAQAEGRAQEKQRMAANSRKASKTAAGTVAYDDGSAGLGIRDAGIKTGS
ncbi:hypothetical protein WOLCODRAFT_159461 [Wolfiporia cocos MD-104 SS10]|uniref:Uncharacterized protein n=1 Tax=Wolfiporia cocos (strain MD-104) TaxID=742152 RepID=A0A2H3J7S3_WOLCO|nr:hypothetical protein WOLCODRAFT_159461 [Wolfiporia cocos MD-104 SS10]